MLDELSVTNLGIIEAARIKLEPGMVVVSGETGAGKTLMLGALRMLTGAPTRSGLIGPHGKEAQVEGRFFLDGEEVVLARSLHPRGSRAYLDGRMVPARSLAERIEGAVEIVGQHDPLSLTRPQAVRYLIDLRLESPQVVDRYQTAWTSLQEVEALKNTLGGDLRSLEREMDLLTYQIGEIDRAGFQIGDDQALESESKRLGNAEDISLLLAESHRELSALTEGVGSAVHAVRKVHELDSTKEGLVEMVEGLEATLTETLSSTREAWEDSEIDPERLSIVNDRLTLLGDLRRKYGSGVEEILQFRQESRNRLDQLEELVDRAARLNQDYEAASSALKKAGEKLRRARRKSAGLIEKEAAEHLTELGFSDPRLLIRVGESEPKTYGADTLELLFASDSRLTPGPVGKVASGGELSRLVLSLRLASGIDSARIVAFDEIDAGVGGVTALAMGSKLARLSEGRQALCISHLPQVAAFADTHIVVEREGSKAEARQLDEDDRIRELSRMLSGLTDSRPGHHHARELRSLAMSRRQTGSFDAENPAMDVVALNQ
ncbi:MAG: hypothetical protein OXH10_01635 [bacterium]|nr:hypothetical protein [bacterium]MCY3652514.1 hypothetical protein [bacterium]MDE0643915.1 hypothetical protein [bacterium]